MKEPVPETPDPAPLKKGDTSGRRLSTAPLPKGRRKHLRLQIGEVRTSTSPIIMQTLLGSCVAVCLHDPVTLIGGMNHILLPGNCGQCPSTRFGEQAMELLISELIRLGADRQALLAKAFGGANVLPYFQPPTIGDENVKFVREFLASRSIPLIAERLGGEHAVQLSFSTGTGKASVRTVDGSRLQAISKAEESFSLSYTQRTHESRTS